MNSFALAFEEARNTELNFAAIMRFNNKRKRHVGKFCFVEGSSDEFFYKNTHIYDLVSNCEYVFQRYKEQEDDAQFQKLAGKEAVLYCYNLINSNQILKNEMPRCIFIIDYDFDGIYSSRIDLSIEDCNKITATPFHSIENFYVVEDNIKRVFNFFNLKEESYLDFYSKLYEFANTTIDFYALRGAISHNFKNKTNRKDGYEYISYKNKHLNKLIFEFDYRKKPYYNYLFLEDEVERMKDAIKDKPRTIENYKTIKRRINQNPPLYIQGHNVYEFLRGYMLEIHNKNIESNQTKQKIIELLDIGITIVNGCGEILYNYKDS